MKDLILLIKWSFLVMQVPPIIAAGTALLICGLLGYEATGIEFSKIYAVLAMLGYLISIPYYYFHVHKNLVDESSEYCF